MFKKAFSLAMSAVLSAMAVFMVGCSSGDSVVEDVEAASSESSAAYTFVDDLGYEVTVQNPQRVVACMGSFANMWELAGGTLVGVSDDAFTFESFDIASPDVQKVGDFSSINLEAVIALEPDFVIMTCGTGGRGGDSSQADLKAALDASGIPVAYFEVTTFDDYERMMGILCGITGDSQAYAENVEEVGAAIDGVIESVPAEDAPTALLMTTYSGGTRVQSSSSMTGDMLADLGAVNLADKNKSLLSDFSLESIIDLDPDFIFVVPMGNDSEAAMKGLQESTSANPAWATLSAVQENRYIVLDPNLFLYKPNDNWSDAYVVLYEHLYGIAE